MNGDSWWWRRVERYFFFVVHQPHWGLGRLIVEVSRGHTDTTQSAGPLWKKVRPVAETSTWQHITITRDIHARGVIRTLNCSKRAAADRRLRPRGHRKLGGTLVPLLYPYPCQPVKSVATKAGESQRAGQHSWQTDLQFGISRVAGSFTKFASVVSNKYREGVVE